MPKIRAKRLFPSFELMNNPNFEELSRLTRLAMGNRSALSFAKECGLSQATILRILNKQLKAPLTDAVIDAIAKNSTADSQVTLADFLAANGLVRIEENENYASIVENEMISSPRPEYAKRFEAAGIKFIEKCFKRLGFDFSLERGHEFDSIPHYGFDVEYKTDALIKYGITTWSFEFIYHTKNDSRDDFYNKLSKVFAAAFLFPSAMQGRAITVVTNYTDIYEDLLYDFCSAEIPVPISIVCADVIGGKIFEEYQIPMQNDNVQIDILK